MSIHDSFPRIEPPQGAVVVGVDGSASAERAVRWAARLASARRRPLHLVHALALASLGSSFADAYLDAPAVIDAIRAGGRTIVDRASTLAAEEDPDLAVSTELSSETPVATLVRLSAVAYQLTLGEPAAAHSIGSTAIAVAGHSKCPVVVARGDTRPSRRPVVVGIDGSPVSESAIALAFYEASNRRTNLVAVHVCNDLPRGTVARHVPAAGQDPTGCEILAERLAGWQEKYPDVPVQKYVYLDGPREHLTEWSTRAQLVVVGSRGRGGIRGLAMGSTSNALVLQSHCPVLVVRPQESST